MITYKKKISDDTDEDIKESLHLLKNRSQTNLEQCKIASLSVIAY